jgi:hypothetical protein
MFSPLLPGADATAVPLDAALFVASNATESIAFTLRRERPTAVDEAPLAPLLDAGVSSDGETVGRAAPPRDDETTEAALTAASSDALDSASADVAGSDAEGVEVPVAVTCYPAAGGNLCVAKPKVLLEAGARYVWTASMPVSGAEPTAERTTEPRWFTTGDAVADVGSPQLNVEVISHTNYNGHPCGLERSVGMTVSGVDIETPVVVNAKGITPSYVIEPVVLSAEQSEQPFGLYSPPECFIIETFDVTGARADLGEVCPEKLVPATPAVEADPAPPATEPATTATSTSTAMTPESAESGDADDPRDATESNAAASPPDGVEQRGVEADSDGGCAVGPLGVRRSLAATTWLAGAALVVALRRARRRK